MRADASPSPPTLSPPTLSGWAAVRWRVLRAAYQLVYLVVAAALAVLGLGLAFLLAAGWWMPRVLGWPTP